MSANVPRVADVPRKPLKIILTIAVFCGARGMWECRTQFVNCKSILSNIIILSIYKNIFRHDRTATRLLCAVFPLSQFRSLCIIIFHEPLFILAIYQRKLSNINQIPIFHLKPIRRMENCAGNHFLKK